jgi:hypothetical protein
MDICAYSFIIVSFSFLHAICEVRFSPRINSHIIRWYFCCKMTIFSFNFFFYINKTLVLCWVLLTVSIIELIISLRWLLCYCSCVSNLLLLILRVFLVGLFNVDLGFRNFHNVGFYHFMWLITLFWVFIASI